MLFANTVENSLQTNVQVVTRFRPLFATDQVLSAPYLQVDPNSGSIVVSGNKLFQFDYVLPFNCQQYILYNACIEPLINAFMEGFNVSIIGHGQTGSGKTYTIFGPGLLYAMNEADFGMVPRAVRHIFHRLKESPGRQFSIHVSYLEIYHEEIRDLLSIEPFHKEILVQDHNGEIVINGATQMECQSIEEVFTCLETGLAFKHTDPTVLNQLSSRSHTIFMLTLYQTWVQDGLVYETRSKLHFVDLAGSERLGMAGTLQSGTGYQESASVSSGLLALSNVTAALGDPRRKASYVPYWDSKLTWILRDSLGGSALTLMVVCLSPSSSDLDETVNTLQFASRVDNICNRPVRNVRVTPLPPVQFGLSPHQVQPRTCPQEQQERSEAHFVPIGAPAHLYPPPFGHFPAVAARPAGQVAQSKESVVSGSADVGNNQSIDADNNVEDELFKLRFAANQWQQLVSNAESLFKELSSAGVMPSETQNRIESWLCLKEEYQHCIEPDLYAIKPRAAGKQEPLSTTNNSTLQQESFSTYGRRNSEIKALHVIEEVSEPTPSRSSSPDISENSAESSSSEGSEFSDNLDSLKQKFREATDRLISSLEQTYDVSLMQKLAQLNKVEYRPEARPQKSPSSCPTSHGSPVPLTSNDRRVSVFDRNGFDPAQLKGVLEKLEDKQAAHSDSGSSDGSEVSREKSKQLNFLTGSEGEKNSQVEEVLKEEMRRLSETSESRRVQVRQTNRHLRKAQKTLKELRSAIKIKEAFIDDLVQAGRESEMFKKLFHEKIERLERDAAQTRADLSQAQVRLRELEDRAQDGSRQSGKRDESGSDSESDAHRERIAGYKRQIVKYEKRLREVAKLMELTASNPRKVEELQKSLISMKEQQALLKEQLREESEKKKKLQTELEEDHQRIAELERQLRRRNRAQAIALHKSFRDTSVGASEVDSELEHKRKWLEAEEERLATLRTDIEKRSEEVDQRLAVLEKREKRLADKIKRSLTGEEGEKILSENKALQTSLCCSPSLSHSRGNKLSDADKQLVSISFATADVSVDKEAIRKEIHNLRHTRDSLVQQRQALDERHHRERTLTTEEERRLVELDEAVEAVDAAMEFKNEMICNRQQILQSTTEDGLLARLMSLTHPETRALLCKYFSKVIDLRESSKLLEQQFAELEARYKDQSHYVRQLATAFQRTQLEVDRRSAAQQRDYDQKFSHLLRRLGEKSSGGGSSAVDGQVRLLHEELVASQKECRELRRQIRASAATQDRPAAQTDSHQLLTAAATAAIEAAPSTASSRTPSFLGLHALHEKLQGLQRRKGRTPAPATTTTVTREKNKLIIKQQPVLQDSKESKRRR